jgi:hypothetical protein
VGQGAELSVKIVMARKVTKAENGGGATSQPPEAGSWWITVLVSWD